MSIGYILPLDEIIQPAPAMDILPSIQAQTARLLQAEGLNVTCISDPTLSGIYPADSFTVTYLLGVQYFIDRNARFPGGNGQYVVADMSGNPHSFTTAIVTGGGAPPPFTQLVYALADFAAACRAVAITGLGDLPEALATIA